MLFKTKIKKVIKQHPLFHLILPAVFCTLLWGTAFPGIKIGYELFSIGNNDVGSKLLFAGGRFMIAGIIVLVIGNIIPGKSKKIMLRKNDILPISILGFFQTFLQYFLLYLGISYVSGTKSSIYTSAAAFTTVLISPLFFRSDKLNGKKIAGCITGIAGIIFMSLPAGGLDAFSLYGDGLVILSNLSGAAGNIISKKISVKGRTAPMIAGWQLTIGGTALTLTGIFAGGKLPLNSGYGWAVLLYLAAMAGIAFMIWTGLLSKNPVSKVAVFNLLIPVFGTMWSGLFLKENIFTAGNLIALFLVCSGIFLVNSDFKSVKNNKLNLRWFS